MTIVVDDDGEFLGVVDIDQITEAIRDLRAAAVSQARAGLQEQT